MSESTVDATAYWVVRPGEGELRDEAIAIPDGDDVLVARAEVSGVSPGTERLVGLGRVPAEAHERMRGRYMSGSFALPVKYGYDWVGVVERGPRAGERIFAMHPHQTRAVIAAADAVAVPDDVPPARATLIPNLETALNAVWDAALAGDERCVVVGGGIVGVAVAYALAAIGVSSSVPLIERDASRRAALGALPWVAPADAGADPGAFDVAFHATGTGGGLQCAIDAVGFEGRVVDLSWYGDRPVTLALGGTFHAERKRIIGSQVGAVAPSHRATHTPADRVAHVIGWLDDARLDTLTAPVIPFAELPARMREVYAGASLGFSPVVDYRS